jgi:hypothetical protein
MTPNLSSMPAALPGLDTIGPEPNRGGPRAFLSDSARQVWAKFADTQLTPAWKCCALQLSSCPPLELSALLQESAMEEADGAALVFLGLGSDPADVSTSGTSQICFSGEAAA